MTHATEKHTHSYKNPWYETGKKEYGPASYKTNVMPTKYKGFLIFHRHPEIWDVVKDGVCVTQRAGFNGAKSFVDQTTLTPAGGKE